MYSIPTLFLHGIIIGIAATVILDIWVLVAKRAYDAAPANWALAGRWFAHMKDGIYRHDNIAEAMPVRGELAIGWIAHYVVGIVYGILVVAIWFFQNASYPTLYAPLLVGLVLATCAAWFLMQPGLGLGVAARKTPDPLRMRLRTIVNHVVFTLALYLSALALSGYLA
jgi:hypothetical protein